MKIKDQKPKYWGSWKGKIIEAIVKGNSKTWNQIHDFTKLSPKAINRALAELFNMKTVEKVGNNYAVVDLEIKSKYETYSDPENKKQEITFSEKRKKELCSWVEKWKEFKKLNFSLDNDHFFLDGRHLDEISKDLICEAKSEVLVVNPFVSKCDLSDTLKESCERGVVVTLITRQPDDTIAKFQQNKQEYHSSLKNVGVDLNYSKHVHAKIIVIDQSLVILSSMNFYSGSSGGASWEAGIISLEKTVVQTSTNSILKILKTKNKNQKNQSKKIVIKAI